MPEKIEFDTLKHYLRTGEIDPQSLPEDTDLNLLQALMQRRLAHQTDQEVRANFSDHYPDFEPRYPGEEIPHFMPDSQDHRQASREILERSMEVLDFNVLDNVMNSSEIDYEEVFSFLKGLNLSELPVLSSTPVEMQDQLKKQGFKLVIISDDQINFTDFDQILRDPKIPQWFEDQKERKKRKDQKEYIDLAQAIKERWFVMVIILLGVMSTIGFVSNWAVELPPLLGMFDWYLSIYGVAAITRATVQIKRAESWNATARNEIRSPYAEALEELAGNSAKSNPKMKKLLEKAKKTAGKSSSWGEFQKDFGLLMHPNDDKNHKGEERKQSSILGQFAKQRALNPNEVSSQSDTVDDLAETIINREFNGEAPSVAVVIPTYQTPPEVMARLLNSIKDQAYPVTTAYVVYNDNPNDPYDPSKPDSRDKQAEFNAFQKVVDAANAKPGRNRCQIKFLAQPARGKREAMAMGFAHALGKAYYQDLIAKHPEVAAEADGHNNLNNAIANVKLDALPDYRHDYVLNIDSDTEILDPMAVLNSALLMKSHPKAATTTGDVRVVNRNFNLLAEMTYQRYWRAFFVERAAQSKDGHVTCMSGPWVFMKSDALAEVFDEWYYQKSLGQRATYGDDRNLSTLFLEKGHESLFCPDSAVLTDCPTDWDTFIKQQLRWNKSFNRENLLLFAFIHKLDKFTQFDVAYQQVFPFAMLMILVSVFARSIGASVEGELIDGVETIMPYVLAVLFYNELFFGAYGAVKNKDPKFLMSPVYITYHFRSLLWLKIVAFFQAKDNSWGTKGEGMNQTAFEEAAVELYKANRDNILGETIAEVMPEIIEALSEDDDETHSTTGESF